MNRTLGTVALAIALLASPARATNGMRMIGFGPVQNSMGGASVAAPLDGATAVSNPAGLAELAPRVDVAGQGFMPSVKYKADWSMGAPPVTASQSSDRPTDMLPTLAAVYKLQDRYTVGLAVLGTAGMGVEYPAGASGLFGSKLLTSYLNGRVAPAVAYKINDQLSVGVAANVMYAQMEYEAGGGAKHSTASSIGFGGTVGVTYQVSPMVTLGAAYETQSYFQDFEFTVAGETEAIDFDQPMVATLGAAVRPVTGLLLALDGQWINWSATNGKDMPKFTKNAPPAGYGWNMNWSDQFVVKLGAEYQIPALKTLKVRAGYNYGKTPLDKDRGFENLAFPAIAEHHFTIGAGYDIGKLAVNAAFMYSPEATLKGATPMSGLVSYETTMSQTAFELGAAYKF
ncbi:MAG TPA: outer membrane protein transport protein [Anaeromyxobacter sp.]